MPPPSFQNDDEAPGPLDREALRRDLEATRGPEPEAEARVVDRVYDELRRIARKYMARERADHTLQPTELVNEACLRLLPMDQMEDLTARRFLGFGARAMRQVLVDHARRLASDKRGGDWIRVTMQNLPQGDEERDGGVPITTLDAALNVLTETDAQLAELTELHYFAGLTGDQLAEHYETSRSSVNRQLSLARALLLREIDRLETDS